MRNLSQFTTQKGGNYMTAEQFYNFHRSQLDGWEHGEIKEVWTDADCNTCIRYTDGKWWHYNVDKKENIIFW